MAVSPAPGRAPCSKPSLENTTAFRKKRGKKTAFRKKKKKKRERTLLNNLANGSNATANSAGRRRLPEPGSGDGYRQGPAWRGLAAEDGWSQPWAAPAATQGRARVPPAGIFTPLLRPEPPHPAEGEMSTTPLSSTRLLQRCADPGRAAGGPATLLRRLQRAAARTLPPPAAPARGGQPKGPRRLPGQSPTAAALRHPAARESRHPAPSHLFLLNFFFRKQLTLFFEEQQMSETLPVPFMTLNLLPRLRNCCFNDEHSHGCNASQVLASKKEAGGHVVSSLMEENKLQPISWSARKVLPNR